MIVSELSVGKSNFFLKVPTPFVSVNNLIVWFSTVCCLNRQLFGTRTHLILPTYPILFIFAALKTRLFVAKKNKKKLGRWLTISGFLLAIVFAVRAYNIYGDVKKPNVDLKGRKTACIYVRTGSTYSDVVKMLKDSCYVVDIESFDWVARQKNYPQLVKAGRFKIKDGMSNNQLINMLRGGVQEPVKITINKTRSIKRIAEMIGSKLEADELDLYDLLTDNQYLSKFGKTRETAFTLFISDTYYFNWNTSAKEFVERMYAETQKFWDDDRQAKAKAVKLTPDEVYTLASIVEEETLKNDEKPDVAGVYLNRMRIGMPLQADPTVKFAVGDFEIKRILNKHLTVDSPYNTYKHKGLPPGPICIPSKSSIDAVLNYNKHKYLYFCAKDDFSGYHAFARNLIEHNVNAEKYRKALNKNRIYK